MSENPATQTIFRFVTVRSPKKNALENPKGIEYESLEDDYDGFYPADGRVRIRPLGIADFRRVEQKLCGYRPGEVAHIENILQGEYKERSTRRLRRTENTVTQSTEKSSETERDTTTADRHEMQSEAAKTLQQNTALSIGVSVAGSYGPISANLNTQFSSSTASSESDRQAVLYAQEVTNRSLERIIEKVRTERISKLTEEFEENNKHGLDNRGGNQHVVGVYRWVDKIYEAQVVNYGKRLMFEFLLPEPAAFHLWAMSNAGASAQVLMEKPIDPRSAAAVPVFGKSFSRPTDLDRSNYSFLAGHYRALVSTPPPQTQTVEIAYAADQFVALKPFAHAKNDLKIPEGYQPLRARIITGMNLGWISVGIGNDGVYMDCLPGANNKANPRTIELNMENEVGTLPVMICGATDMYAMNICVTCQLTADAYEAWQIKTFQAILEAYENKNAQYQQVVSEAKAQNSIAIQGTNPALNRMIEQQELKKGCLKWLLNNPHFGSVATNYAPTAPDDWSNAEPEFSVGKYVIFYKTFKTNNFDAATWAGDLGTMGAYFLYYLHTKDDYLDDLVRLHRKSEKKFITHSYTELANKWVQEIWQALTNKESSPEDLIGNVDGIVLGTLLKDYKKYIGEPLSTILKKYYIDKDKSYYDSRLYLFLLYTKLNDATMKSKYSQEISDCAMMGFLRNYMGEKFQSVTNFVDAKLENYLSDPYLGLGSTALLLEHFLNGIQQAMIKESNLNRKK